MAAGAQGTGDLAARVTSRKFMQALFVQITGAVALFTGKVDGPTYVTLSALALGIYGVTSIADKRWNPGQQP